MMLVYATEICSITGHTAIDWMIIGAIVGAILFVLFRWIKNASCRNDAAFIQVTIDEIADWLDNQGLINKEDARTELQSAFDGAPTNLFREQLLRLECKFLQTSPTACQQTTTMIFKKGDDIREVTFTKTVRWDELPGDIRKEFIINNQKEISYDFLKRTERK